MGTAAEERGAFAGLLRRYREPASLTQEELAERSGLTSRAISDMERGRSTRPLPEFGPELGWPEAAGHNLAENGHHPAGA